MSIRDKLLSAIERYHLLEPADRVLVAVSGGQDSVTLLLLLTDLAHELQLSLVVAHLHHGLRGAQADSDQRSVAALAADLGLPFAVERTKVAALAQNERLSLEEAGRVARYRFFQAAAEQHSCTKIAVAHTATDRAETLLMNLFRGAGLYGLRSIPPRRDNIIRPLILATRQETADFCRMRGMKACHDSYNADLSLLRNRLRAELLPQLEREYGPGIEAALCRAADHLLEEIEWTEPVVQQTCERLMRVGGILVKGLQSLAPGLRHRVLRRFVLSEGLPLTGLSRAAWEALDRLISVGLTGNKLELTPGQFVQIEYDLLKVTPAEPAEVLMTQLELSVPGCLLLPDGSLLEARLVTAPPDFPAANDPVAVLDADKSGPLLLVRQPRQGDRFVPLGMTGSKKLQDFFVDSKVPPRGRRPLLVLRADGDILWIVGHRVAQTASVDEETRTHLILTVSSRDLEVS